MQQGKGFGGDKLATNFMTGETAAFQQEDTRAGACERDSGGGTGRSGTDDSDLVREHPALSIVQAGALTCDESVGRDLTNTGDEDLCCAAGVVFFRGGAPHTNTRRACKRLNDAQDVLPHIRMLSPGHHRAGCESEPKRIAMIFEIERYFSSCHKHPDGPNGNWNARAPGVHSVVL